MTAELYAVRDAAQEVDLADPQPQTLRWQPLRLGLVDLFYYENEVFPFRDGRLLLRGNNGAGKSKVLALTLPFLLDGDTSARRVEPDADPAKRMDWNLLLGGEFPHSERLGYTWVEFGRRDEDGVPHYLTIGAGLKAARGRGMTKNWFFTTRQRVGHQLSLLDEGRRALTRDRLVIELGDAGRVYDTKRDYRRSVDEKLFSLGERRYDALIDLLLQIRAPQLSKRPSEKLLSDALTESLTPVGRDIIESVAEALRGLDEEREQLQELTDAHRSVLAFLDHYRRYARVLVKRRADEPRKTQAEHDRLGREIIELSREGADAAAALERASTDLETLRRRQTEREAEREALRDSEYVELEAQLASADNAVGTAQGRLDRAGSERDRTASSATRAGETAAAERTRALEAQQRHATALAETTAAATAAHIEHHHDDVPHDVSLADDRRESSARLSRAREALALVRQLLDSLAAAEAELAEGRRRDDAAETRAADAATERLKADAAVETEVSRYVELVEAAIRRLSELVVADAEFAAFADWVPQRAGENPAVLALEASAAELSGRLHSELASIRHQREELLSQVTELDKEIAALDGGETAQPPLWHVRETTSGEGLPLWRAVSFHDHVGEADRAGLEAALEASGLLTARILPGGEVRHPESGEVILVASAENPAAATGTLLELLRVELPEGADIEPAAMESVLASIALAQGAAETNASVWVSATGLFRLGAARGAWAKPAAAFIGESARADARRTRLAVARAERAELAAREQAAVAAREQLNARLLTVSAEQRSLPRPTELEAAARAASVAASRVAEAQRDREETQRVVAGLTAVRDERAADLTADAKLLRLPDDAESIAKRTRSLNDYEQHAREFWHAAESLVDANRVSAEAERQLDEHQRGAERAQAEFADASTEIAARTSYATTLRGSVGEDVAQYRARVSEVESELVRIKSDLVEAGGRREDAVKLAARLDERLSGVSVRQEDAAAERVSSVELLRRTAALGFMRVALPQVEQPDSSTEWTVTQGVQLARAIEQALADLDASDQRFDRLLSQVHAEFTALQRSLGRHGHEAVSYPRDEGYHVLVVFMGKEVSLVELADGLSGELEQRERMLGAREREVIENHLVTEIGAQLSELIGHAETQIADINSELASRPTSTGMKLRVRWKPRPDGPAGLAAVRARFATTSDVWDEDDRTALGEFLQARIAEVRQSDESGNWYDHLGEALDYRRWHHFAVERYQSGAWKPATGPASGGERVLAASIPLFAAASSHYRTAGNPHAPRLIMLDEAFAGVDDNSRASCLGLLAAFDLDVVMTSEREWGCYAEVPGLSIAQLTRFDDTPAVLVQLWTWDGRQRTEVGSAEPVSDAIW